LDKALEQLRQVILTACHPGNITDEYMLGMANGLILAQAIIENKTPNYLGRQMISRHDDKIQSPSIQSR
jgi:hypothetical protein